MPRRAIICLHGNCIVFQNEQVQVSSAITIDPALVSASYASPFITNLTFDEQLICLRTNVKAYGISSCMY